MLALFLACSTPDATAGTTGTVASAPVAAGQAEAVFASGCFWCSESDFEKFPGVVSVESGYIGGSESNPTYEQVGGGRTGHVDPFDAGGQFCDRGRQYRPAIFPRSAEQRKAAEASRAAAEKVLGRPVSVTIESAVTFWVAEAYHQDFYRTNPGRYGSYRAGCGRDARVAEVWSGVRGP